MIRRCLFLIWLSCCLAGCLDLNESRIVLCTNRAEFAAYMEIFNAATDDLKVEILYRPEPVDVLADKKSLPDLIIGEWLADPALTDMFEPLDALFEEKRIDADSFYADLLHLGRHDEKQYLLPLNFDLPAVVFRSEVRQGSANNLTLSLDTIRRMAADFNFEEQGLFKQIGFSPLWNQELLYYTARLFGADIRADAEATLRWEQKNLERTAAFLQSWLSETGNSRDREARFRATYMTIPENRLLEERRILFFLTDTKSFFSIPQEKRENLDFRWLSRNGRIPVLDNVLFAGIPRGADNVTGALELLSWLFQHDTQTRLMRINHFKRLQGTYGVAGGFSALTVINERDLPQPDHYPLLLGHIPSSEMLLFPPLLPRNWRNLKQDVIIPWLLGAASEGKVKPSLSTLLEDVGGT